MKKFTLMMVVMLACLFRVNAQEPQFVSTEVQKRNVLIEELTGRTCPNCPAGQRVVNNVIAKNPEKTFTVNIHAKNIGYSPSNYNDNYLGYVSAKKSLAISSNVCAVKILNYLPFAGMANNPVLILLMKFNIHESLSVIGLSLFWLVILEFIAFILFKHASKKITVHGG